MRKTKGNLIVVDFDVYKKRCDYRWFPKKDLNLEICAYYGRESGTICSKEICPYAEWVIESIKYEVPNLTYIM